MHPNFPMDPITIAIGIIAVLAAILGFVGGAGNPVIWGVIMFLFVAAPLLFLEWLGYFIYERFIEPKRA